MSDLEKSLRSFAAVSFKLQKEGKSFNPLALFIYCLRHHSGSTSQSEVEPDSNQTDKFTDKTDQKEIT